MSKFSKRPAGYKPNRDVESNARLVLAVVAVIFIGIMLVNAQIVGVAATSTPDPCKETRERYHDTLPLVNAALAANDDAKWDYWRREMNVAADRLEALGCN